MTLALNYLHNNPFFTIIHRDIKPENILIYENDHIKLADFGIAKYSQKTDIHPLLDVSGTPGFMAPEISTGKGYN